MRGDVAKFRLQSENPRCPGSLLPSLARSRRFSLTLMTLKPAKHFRAAADRYHQPNERREQRRRFQQYQNWKRQAKGGILDEERLSAPPHQCSWTLARFSRSSSDHGWDLEDRNYAWMIPVRIPECRVSESRSPFRMRDLGYGRTRLSRAIVRPTAHVLPELKLPREGRPDKATTSSSDA